MFGRKFILLFLLLGSLNLQAQQTTIFTEAQLSYKRGMDFYNRGLIGLAQKEFGQTLNLLRPVNESEARLLKTKAELNHAKCAVKLKQPDGEKLILDFTRAHSPDPIASEAIIEMADYYYNAKEYDKASSLYSKIDPYDLGRDERSEIKFKQGYALFVKKKFPKAKACFKGIKDIENRYYYPSNYYYGMCSFFEDNYGDAIASFQRVSNSKKYKSQVPYYISQIYFAQGNLDQLLAYAEPKVENSQANKKNEIHQLIGQAYYEKGNYEKALYHLEAFAAKASKIRKEDMYQLGYVQYKIGEYDKAAKNLTQLNNIDSPLGQHAMYILGDCLVKTEDKNAAKNAFKVASQMNYDKAVKEEALFNYAKLCYDLKTDREAITALQAIKTESVHYSEAQTMLSDLFLNTRDYEKAMNIIEAIPEKTPTLRETYQKIAYYRGLQLYKDNKYNEAKIMFDKSLKVPKDRSTQALANYWLGQIAYKELKYTKSNNLLQQFLDLSSGAVLPAEASVKLAKYTIGYNYLKQKKYGQALKNFEGAAAGIRADYGRINNDYIKQQVLGDAILRAGDCNFKQNNYKNAVANYSEVVKQKFPGFVYALYQKAIIKGLQGEVTEKIIDLEKITVNYANNQYADDALLQLGYSYMEMGKKEQAKAPLKKLVNNYKDRSNLVNQGYLNLGLITYNQGDLQGAISYYKKVYNNNPTSNEAIAAEKALEEIYIDDLNDPDGFFNYMATIGHQVDSDEKDLLNFKAAEAQFEAGNYTKAIDGYQRYLKKYPGGRHLIEALYHLAESYAVLKDYGEAIDAYEKVAQKGQGKYYAKSLRKAAVIAYNHSLDFSRAYRLYKDLEVVATSEDMRFEAQLGAMRSAYRVNDQAGVFAMANKVNNNPQASQDHKATANFYIGKIEFDKNNGDSALTAFNEVIKLSDNEQTAEARYLVAYIYYKKRELNVAKQLCINATKESSSYIYWVAKSVILLADVLAEQGDLFNARAALEGLLENYDEDPELVSIAKTKLEQLIAREQSSSRIKEEHTDESTLEMENN